MILCLFALICRCAYLPLSPYCSLFLSLRRAAVPTRSSIVAPVFGPLASAMAAAMADAAQAALMAAAAIDGEWMGMAPGLALRIRHT